VLKGVGSGLALGAPALTFLVARRASCVVRAHLGELLVDAKYITYFECVDGRRIYGNEPQPAAWR
jgi:hypothetical protein